MVYMQTTSNSFEELTNHVSSKIEEELERSKKTMKQAKSEREGMRP